MPRVPGAVVRTKLFKRPHWTEDEELDTLLGQWRRHVVGVHRMSITAATEPHIIDECTHCMSIVDEWEAILGYQRGI